MLKTNEYFEGKVKSIALENSEGISTVGVMDVGEYEFGTSSIEHMTVVSGNLDVMLPDSDEWRVYKKGETFIIAKDSKFQVKATGQVAYFCLYK